MKVTDLSFVNCPPVVLRHHIFMVSYLLVFDLPVLFDANRGGQRRFLGGGRDSGFIVGGVW